MSQQERGSVEGGDSSYKINEHRLPYHAPAEYELN